MVTPCIEKKTGGMLYWTDVRFKMLLTFKALMPLLANLNSETGGSLCKTTKRFNVFQNYLLLHEVHLTDKNRETLIDIHYNEYWVVELARIRDI